jgi:hypothetical protein
MTRAYNTATTQQNSGGAVAGVTAGKNGIINGGFDIWQRGTSVAVASNVFGYTADRWLTNQQSAITVSRQATGDTTNLPNIQYCARYQRDAGQTSTTVVQLTQPFENVNSTPYVGKTVTLSFYARKGANFSQASSQLSFQLYTGTGFDQNLLGSYTGASIPISTSVTLTSTWQRFTATGTIGTSVTEIAPYFFYIPTGTAGAADYYEITGVQLEVGSVATPFSRNAGTLQGELAACQRYYSRVNGTTVGGATWINGHITGSSPAYAIACYQYPVEMRVAPTITQSGSVRVSSASTLNDFSSFAGGAAVKSLRTLYTPTSVTNGYACHIDFLSTAFIEMSAEL